MRKIIVATLIVAMTLIVLDLNAQSRNRSDYRGEYKKERRAEQRDRDRDGDGRYNNNECLLYQMAEDLELNDKQKVQVEDLRKKLNEEYIDAKTTSNKRGKPTQAEIDARRDAYHNHCRNMDEGMKKILSNEQYKEWGDMYQYKMRGRGERDYEGQWDGRERRTRNVRPGHKAAMHNCYCGSGHGSTYRAPEEATTE